MTLAVAPRREQRRLAAMLDSLKIAPFRAGDLQERDTQGRRHEVLVAGDWVITYWLDHAVRELRIVGLEPIAD